VVRVGVLIMRIVQRMRVSERRARLGHRHRLAAPAPSPLDVARSMVALHGSDPSTVYLSIWARTGDGKVAAVERALYDDRSMLRLLAMRRTVFVVPTELAPVVLAGASRGVAAQERRRLLSIITDNAITKDPAALLAEVERVTLDALIALGSATGNRLNEADPRLGTELVLAKGKPYEGTSRLGSRVLLLLAAEGHVVRGRPLGSWTSTQFQWSPADVWCPDGLPVLPAADAEVALARRWLAAFGPATVEDLRWWTGWTVTQTRRALATIAPAEVDLDGEPGIVLADDLAPVEPPEPWVALLPALDPTPMGWRRRDFYLGTHTDALFDRTGNISPTVWCDGRVVGGWAQRATGEVVFRLFEDIGTEPAAALERAAGELSARLGDVRLSTRARSASPTERDLRA
jgi:DNA glycosylase AlkZ-like